MIISVLSAPRVWAAMVLLAAVFSWPVGLWVLDLSTRVIPAGVPGARLLPLFAGPLVNGATFGAVLGCIISLGQRNRELAD